MDNLTEIEKETLKYFVAAIDAGAVDKEFHVFMSLQGTHLNGKEGFIPTPHQFTFLTLDGLDEAGFIKRRITGKGDAICAITPKGLQAVATNFHFPPNTHEKQSKAIDTTPPEIRDSLEEFREKYPDPSKVAFIMERFGETKAHKQITETIRATLLEQGITALRADDFEFHHDLFPNILTYIYGSSFGIAIFERIEKDDFNPNVALEVGYMLALSKPVCLFKDKNHTTLPADLGGKLFKKFDPQEPEKTIPKSLKSWLISKGIINGEPPKKIMNKELEDALNRITRLTAIIEKPDSACPQCLSSLIHEGTNTYEYGDQDHSTCVYLYACGSVYEDSEEICPCGTPLPTFDQNEES